ncbi:hypothetical protein [Mycobacterium sp. URHB0021]
MPRIALQTLLGRAAFICQFHSSTQGSGSASMVIVGQQNFQCGVAEGNEAVFAGDAGKRAGESLVDQGGDD